MAKDNKKNESGDETQSQQQQPSAMSEVSKPVPVSENVETADPLVVIAFALVDVAKGASVIALREAVRAGAPDDREGRIEYAKRLRRLRDGADVALTIGLELASGV